VLRAVSFPSKPAMALENSPVVFFAGGPTLEERVSDFMGLLKLIFFSPHSQFFPPFPTKELTGPQT